MSSSSNWSSKAKSGMSAVLSGSIALKGIGAALEVAVQILVTRNYGVAGYGDYSFYVGVADLVFWVLFSGIVKCNAFYLTDENSGISNFRRRFYGLYVMPVVAIVMLSGIFLGFYLLCVTSLILLFEVVLFDKSSQLLARGEYAISLSGEYVLGRLVLAGSVAALIAFGRIDMASLLVAYAMQLLFVNIFFIAMARRRAVSCDLTVEQKVSLKKFFQFQESDLVTALIGQAPVVLQYVVAGAFSAGLVGVVSLVRRVVNFFSGPAAKVFLPEFARCCREGDREGAKKLYSLIVRIQMLFVSVASVALVGFPEVILHLFNDDLDGYGSILRWTSACFLIAAMLGPAGGLLQMAGRESQVSLTKNISAAAMLAVWICMLSDQYFVLYGICIELLLETVVLYVLVSMYFKSLPVSIRIYARAVAPTVIALTVSCIVGSDSVVGMAALLVFVAVAQVVIEYKSGLFRGFLGRGSDAHRKK